MARKALQESEKRKVIGARFSPDAREKIAQRAKQNRRSITAEVEALATEFIDYRPEIVTLLRIIAKRITAIETRTKSTKGFLEDLKTWAAVSEMLAHVLDGARPDRPMDDEVVMDAKLELDKAEFERRTKIQRLASAGIAVNESAKPPVMRGVPAGLLGIGLSTSPRTWEEASIRAIPDEALRKVATTLFEQLLSTDKAVEEAEEKYAEAMQPYWQAEQHGRSIGAEVQSEMPNQLALASELRRRIARKSLGD